MSKVIYKKFRIQKSFVLCFLLIIITALVNHSASATTDVVDRAMIGVPPSCTMRGSGMNSHNAEIPNGTINSAIGETNVNIFCNDDAGYAIYAIGYTDDTDGKTVLTSSSLGSGSDIATGTLTSGGNSQWAMKLSTQTSPTPAYPVTIQNSFDSFHAVPSEYTLVAKRTTGTDVGTNATGSNFKTTYQVYVSSSQLAGTYVGQVKYTLVHPNTTPIPNSTMLDTGQVVAAKMKTLAAGGTTTAYNAKTSDIKAIRMADSLPSGFTPSEANTVSTSTSKHPIYIFYDNTNDAGIMYFYTGGYQVVMNSDSASLFRGNLALADISGLENWDSSNVANMHALFIDSTISLTNLDPLAKWDTSNVENMQSTFSTNPSSFQAGYISSLSDITALANWDTSNVTNMQQMFSLDTSLTDISTLSFWDTSNVTNMAWMFADLPITNVDALSNWDVSNVESMQAMFHIDAWLHDDYGFNSQLEDISGLANWNTGSVTNMSGMFGYSIITNLDSLSRWDVSNVSNMRQMFIQTTNLRDVSGIKNWDVTGVTATAGSGSSSTNNFYTMFNGSAATPEPFTLRAGSWNSSGTYVPSA
ncbi:BspA family leucine-rich repeat surface protein [Candidatus Saccharibacteria bacterium]|nr:BspA family leucine-rich repeat surface protein [Candidatus Saccharibacteria bacterium]